MIVIPVIGGWTNSLAPNTSSRPLLPRNYFITTHSRDIKCGDETQCVKEDCDPERCTKPSWNPDSKPSFSINESTVRKDTVMVPAGGYVVINFLSNNSGRNHKDGN